MLNQVTMGQYFPGNSLIHRLDPRMKIILISIDIVLLFSVNYLLGFVIAGFILCVGMVLSQIKLRILIQGLKPVMVFVTITALFNLFFMKTGVIIWEMGIIKITTDGVLITAKMVIRILLLMMTSSLLTYTTSPILLTDGLEDLLKPLKKIKFPAHEMAMMMSIAMRFIPTLIEETQRIMAAQKARGADFESGNIIQRAKAMIPILIPLFVSAFRRADELAVAMECRCYHGGEGRTRMRQLAYHKCDLYALCFLVASFIMVLLINKWEVTIL